MTFKEKKENAKHVDCTTLCEPARETGYICPVCESGKHKNGTGMKYYANTNIMYCFSCKKYYDSIDLYQHKYNVEYKDAIERLNGGTYEIVKHIVKEPIREKKDFTDYIKTCKLTFMQDIKDKGDAYQYMISRGFMPEEIKMCVDCYDVGYDSKHIDYKNGDYEIISRRIIFPSTGFNHYVARSIEKAPKIKAYNPKGAKVDIFNFECCMNPCVKVVFVCEGIINALSVIMSGYDAIAINSVANTKIMLNKLTDEHKRIKWVIAMDNDNAGREATKRLVKGMNDKGIYPLLADIEGLKDKYDINDLFRDNREKLTQELKRIVKEGKSVRTESEQREKAVKNEVPNKDYVLTAEQIMGVVEKQDGEYIHIPNFDKISKAMRLKMRQTTIIGAETGIGKSSLALNWVHGLSEQYNVLYFNLEMAPRIVYNRLIAIDSGLKLDDIESFTKQDKETQEKIRESANSIAQRHIKVFDHVSRIDEIIKHIEQEEKDGDMPETIVIIDHLHNITTKENSEEYKRLSQISETFLDFYSKHNVCIILLAQQNREGKKDNKEPSLSSLNGCGKLEQDATRVCFLWNKERENGKPQLKFLIKKAREGQTTDSEGVNLDFDKPTQRMSEKKDEFIPVKDIPDAFKDSEQVKLQLNKPYDQK